MREEKGRPFLKATHQGEITVGTLKIPCAVLNNKERVVSIRGMALALGVKGGGAYWKTKKDNPDQKMLPEFISAKNIEPYVQERLAEIMAGTIPYTALLGQDAVGLKAEVIPKICDIWVKALLDNKLTEKQRFVAEKSRILLGAFAEVGITALIDEATGYQKDKDEYQKIVERYIAKELQNWIKTFGEDYYFQIYRLKGWDWKRFSIDRKNHPWAVANITNRIVYEKLPAGVLDKLNELNPANEKGVRKHKQFQHLTPNEGYVHLLKHLGAVVSIMEQYQDGEWDQALHAIDRRFPSLNDPYQLSLDDVIANKRIFQDTITRAALIAPTTEQTKDSD